MPRHNAEGEFSGFDLNTKQFTEFSMIQGEVHADQKPTATSPAALAQQQQLTERQALSAENASERNNVDRVLIGKEADAFVKAKSGKQVYIDEVAITKENKYLLTQAVDQSIQRSLRQLQEAGEAVGHQQVTAYTVTLPEHFVDRIYSVENGLVYEKQGNQKIQYLIHSKPVQVMYAQGQGVSGHSSPSETFMSTELSARF